MIDSHLGLQVHPITTARPERVMPTWKTFDEETAAALRQRLEEGVSVETLTQPLFENGDSVVVAPTLQKGAAMVITARRKPPEPAVPALEPERDAHPVAEPAQSEPEPESVLPPVAEGASACENARPHETEPKAVLEEASPAEFIFGPTVWERAETSNDTFPAENDFQLEVSSTDPGIWDMPSETPPQPWNDATQSEPPVIETSATWDDDRHVATGFLGLDDYVEDEEEIARSKRPWWKKIFSD